MNHPKALNHDCIWPFVSGDDMQDDRQLYGVEQLFITDNVGLELAKSVISRYSCLSGLD